MKLFTTTLLSALALSGVAYADEFGARFTNDAPSALQSPVAPQDIEPAAGPYYDSDNELERRFDTEVNSTVTETGDGESMQRHDSVGEGDVRLFYQNEKNDRLMDDDDAIGVELKLLEFQ